MANQTCEQCNGPMPIMARSHALTCSPRCRKARSRQRTTVPVELTGRPRWIRRTGRKVPIAVDGHQASSTDPATWSAYREAKASSAGVGLGFVLNGDGIACIDLDHCLDGDRLADWASRLLDLAPGCWVERSVSGEGLHVWGLGKLERGRRITVDGGSVELYADGRYIAVTGETWGDTSRRLGDLTKLIDALL
ncbi:bifunctional DNA primase/polymerase [Streptomyces sp. NPDC059015]|uniref:bifunctional DNA primase/polymerase n=1 Tax=unclassified Streptomyces TaxID=2593676 RepID=UPI0036B7AFDB